MENRSLGHSIKTINNLMHRSFERDRKRCMGDDATVMHIWILIFIARRGDKPTFQKDVEKEFRISKSTVTNIIKLMEKKKLITRVSVDYDDRLKRLCLTDKGREITDGMEQMAMESDRALIRGIDKDKLDIFYEVLDQIKYNIEQDLR